MGSVETSRTIVDIREHVLFVGVTMTGKTTLARHHARILDKADYDPAVYDPVLTETAGGGWPERARVFNDPDKFLAYLDGAKGTPERPVFVFVDEAADIFSHSFTDAHWIPRRIRHQHIYLRLICQRPKMLHPNVRSQCAIVYMLRLASDDAKVVLSDFGHDPSIIETPLDKGDFLMLVSGSQEIEDANVFELVSSTRKR